MQISGNEPLSVILSITKKFKKKKGKPQNAKKTKQTEARRNGAINP